MFIKFDIIERSTLDHHLVWGLTVGQITKHVSSLAFADSIKQLVDPRILDPLFFHYWQHKPHHILYIYAQLSLIPNAKGHHSAFLKFCVVSSAD